MAKKTTENIEDIYPLSPLQQGMLFHSLLHEDSGVYLMQDRYRLKGKLHVENFLNAWKQVILFHPTLRASFSWKTQKQPLQIIHKAVDPFVEFIDLTEELEQQQETYIDDLLLDEQKTGLNLAKPSLIRVRLLKLGDDTYELVRSFHHILMDAWCISLVMLDVVNVYDALQKGQEPAIQKPRPFRHYIAWLHKRDKALDQAFWEKQLEGMDSPTPLVVEHAGRQSQYSQAVLVNDKSLYLDKEQTQALHQLCQQQRVTPNTLFQAVWGLLLARYNDNNDVLFGVTVSGRPPELPGVEAMIGLFINTLPLRIRIDENTTVSQWLNQLQDVNLALREYEHSSLVDIQGWSDFQRGEELFDSILVYENAPVDSRLLRDDLSISLDTMEHSVHTHYGLTVVILPEEELGMRISYDRSRFNDTVIERMLGHMRELVLQMIEAPTTRLASLELLTAAEKQQLVNEWNQTSANFPLDKTYSQLFSEQVKLYPEKIAAHHYSRTGQSEQLSYAQLNERANCLASALVNAGIGCDQTVAVLADRSLEFLASLIAIFKVGAAYVPLEVKHPAQRLAQILSLSDTPALLVSDRQHDLLNEVKTHLPTTPSFSQHTLTIESLWLEGNAIETQQTASPDDLAYVIFTSGSTGTPKGALVEQRGMLNNIFGKVPTLGLNCLLYTSPSPRDRG